MLCSLRWGAPLAFGQTSLPVEQLREEAAKSLDRFGNLRDLTRIREQVLMQDTHGLVAVSVLGNGQCVIAWVQSVPVLFTQVMPFLGLWAVSDDMLRGR